MENKPPLSIVKNRNRIHGFLFDLGLTAGVFLFAIPAFDLGWELPENTIGLLLLAAVAAQCAGAALKKGPLGVRWDNQRVMAGKGIVDNFMRIVLFLHFLLFTIITLLGLDLADFVDLNQNNDVWVLFSLLVGALTTFFVWWAGKPPTEGGDDRPFYPLLEFAADLVLLFSVLIITRFIWEGLFTDIEPIRGIGLSGRSIVFLVATSILFVVFYIPSRYLFLVEDYRYPGTWLQLWLPMVPLAWGVLVG